MGARWAAWCFPALKVVMEIILNSFSAKSHGWSFLLTTFLLGTPGTAKWKIVQGCQIVSSVPPLLLVLKDSTVHFYIEAFRCGWDVVR